MTSYADLDKRCITFSIHMDDPDRHDPLCRTLFDTIEAYFTKLLGKNPKVSHCGLFSAPDVNGSKFSGADRDSRQNHCHGCIFIPHGIGTQDVERLLRQLEITAHEAVGVKCGADAIWFALFDRHSHTATLAHCIGYAMKDSTRIEATGTFAVILPFDDRVSINVQNKDRIERRQAEILRVLGGQDRFKIYRGMR